MLFADTSRLFSRRVVVTGMGTVSPLGRGLEPSWQRLIAGDSGIVSLPDSCYAQMPCRVAAPVPVTGAGSFVPTDIVEEADIKRMDRFIILALAATQDALQDSGILQHPRLDLDRIGTMIGSGIGGISTIADTVLRLNEFGYRRVSPFFLPSALSNLASGVVAIKYGFGGPVHANCTACATSAQAIGEAAKMILLNEADVMVVGGSEAAICPIGMAGFVACRAMSTHFNDDPKRASRPWDKARDGFVMGEGSGVLVLEEYQHAKNRGAKIYAETAGYGCRADVHHVTSPDPSGHGAYNAMHDALLGAEMNPADIDYINAHATSTPAGDEVEIIAVHKLFKDSNKPRTMSSIKSSIGHLLGASGSTEFIFSLLAMRDGIVPATITLEDPIDSMGIDLVPQKPKKMPISSVLKNSFGFGGVNASLVARRI